MATADNLEPVSKPACTHKEIVITVHMDRYYKEIPDDLWKRIIKILPPEKAKPRGGRPAVPARQIMAGIIYRMKTGCQWRAIPDSFGSGQTIHRRFQQWVKAGIFPRIHKEILLYYNVKKPIEWEWTSMDAAIVKAPKGGS